MIALPKPMLAVLREASAMTPAQLAAVCAATPTPKALGNGTLNPLAAIVRVDPEQRALDAELIRRANRLGRKVGHYSDYDPAHRQCRLTAAIQGEVYARMYADRLSPKLVALLRKGWAAA
jgi:hypothetical protein